MFRNIKEFLFPKKVNNPLDIYDLLCTFCLKNFRTYYKNIQLCGAVCPMCALKYLDPKLHPEIYPGKWNYQKPTNFY